ncbi:MAG: hypothetical protein WC869_12560 [Phycisphaerae bacterium]|jgi:hypothetical protein
MASYKLNVARIRGCPSPAKVAAALQQFGLPETEEFGVLNHSASEHAAFATIVRRSQSSVQQLDTDSKEVTAAPVERVTLYPFGVHPARETLEVYAGSATGIEQVGAFFSGCLGFATVTEAIEIDIVAALEKLLADTQRFQIRSVRLSEYAYDSYTMGPYTPKFLDNDHAQKFLEKYAEAVTTASVKFAAPHGRANATLTAKACFTYSCNEDDQPHVQAVLRKLI